MYANGFWAGLSLGKQLKLPCFSYSDVQFSSFLIKLLIVQNRQERCVKTVIIIEKTVNFWRNCVFEDYSSQNGIDVFNER